MLSQEDDVDSSSCHLRDEAANTWFKDNRYSTTTALFRTLNLYRDINFCKNVIPKSLAPFHSFLSDFTTFFERRDFLLYLFSLDFLRLEFQTDCCERGLTFCESDKKNHTEYLFSTPSLQLWFLHLTSSSFFRLFSCLSIRFIIFHVIIFHVIISCIPD